MGKARQRSPARRNKALVAWNGMQWAQMRFAKRLFKQAANSGRGRTTRLEQRNARCGRAPGMLRRRCLRGHQGGQRRRGALQGVAQRKLVEQKAIH